MQFFKSPRERFQNAVETDFGPWLRSGGWTKDESQSHFSGVGSWEVYQLGSIRLRLTSDRGGAIVAEVAPAEPTSGWFDSEWHWLSAVIAWQQTGVARGKDIRPSPNAQELAAHLQTIERFCSRAGAADRERFVEHMTWPSK